MSDGELPDPQQLLKLARKTMSSAERRKKYRRLDFMDLSFWYPTQIKFFAAGSSGIYQRLIYGGNQTGKTECCAAEIAWHALGAYPDWWTGKRCAKPVLIWVLSESAVLGRDTVQKKLCGETELGTGMIPLEAFARKPIMLAGGMGVVDTLSIVHLDEKGSPDGISTIVFKSYEQRREKLQGATVDLVWCDEKPPMDVYSELVARTSATDGQIIVSYTPVGAGGGEGVTYKYLSEYSPDRAAFRISADEVKHISEDRRAVLAAEYGDSERETRIEGTPQLGSGPVFPIELLSGMTKPVDWNSLHPWSRMIVGIDFGFDHPFAAVLIAWTPDIEQVHVIDSFRMERSSALYHVRRIHQMCQGLRIPVAYPHDGGVHDKGSGLSLALQYKNYGANMLAKHATNFKTGDYTVAPAIEEIRELMFQGRLTIGGHNHELLDEIRSYHRDENFKIVKVRDDLVSAFRYAVMMRRSGKPRSECEGIGTGGGGMPYAGQQPDRSQRRTSQFARGTPNHPDGDMNPFTGE